MSFLYYCKASERKPFAQRGSKKKSRESKDAFHSNEKPKQYNPNYGHKPKQRNPNPWKEKGRRSKGADRLSKVWDRITLNANCEISEESNVLIGGYCRKNQLNYTEYHQIAYLSFPGYCGTNKVKERRRVRRTEFTKKNKDEAEMLYNEVMDDIYLIRFYISVYQTDKMDNSIPLRDGVDCIFCPQRGEQNEITETKCPKCRFPYLSFK